MSAGKIKVQICLFDKNCEEYQTDVIFSFHENDLMEDIFGYFVYLANKDLELKRVAKELGAYDFSRWNYFDDFTIQTDCRENVIRFRSKDDTIGEPGNIARMFNLRLVE